MTSYGLIFKLCIGIWVVALMDGISTDAAWAFTISFVILDLMGVFKKDREIIVERLQQKADEQEDVQESRAEEFKRKLREAQENVPEAVLNISDPNGKEGKIFFKSNGEVIVTGEVDPNVVKAAENLKEGIKMFGVETIVEEFSRQMKEYYEERDKE
jgi:hypothetical protein